MPTTIVLFHNNLRVADNRALSWAAERGAVIPLYIHAPAKADAYPMGGASLWWLREALKNLDENLQKLGASLVLRHGDRAKILQEIIQSNGVTAIAWNRRYEPEYAVQDDRLAAKLRAEGIDVSIHDGFLLFDPASIRTGGGTPFKVFTPFSKACFAVASPPKPMPAPKKLCGVDGVKSDILDDWKLVSKTAVWPKGLHDAWRATEQTAHQQLYDFIDGILNHYKSDRDLPAREGTSRLSPYLHFGQISPHQIWYAIQSVRTDTSINGASIERFLLEILWREFSWHLLYQFPALAEKPLTPSFANFPWVKNDRALTAWQKGMTGYPLIDAGMRQLWQTGWMHNRVRMIVASFLIKDLLIDWREGAAWFWDTLVDADLGSNSASWQWVAGCGADAAPFFRIFNPILQGQKFDPSGEYVRRYVPELAKLDERWIHEPWAVPALELGKAGIILGKTYPKPMIDHNHARKRALAALASIKPGGQKLTQDELSLFPDPSTD